MTAHIKILSFIALMLLAAASSADEYTVQAGDSMRKILAKQGYVGNPQELLVEIASIVNSNPTAFKNNNADLIQPGTTLVLPNYRPEPEPEPEPILLPPTIGQMTTKKGNTQIVRDGETLTATSVAALFSGDKVITQTDTLTRMEMSDGTLFELGPNTEFMIDEFNWPKENSDTTATAEPESAGHAITTLLKGVIRAVTGKLGLNKDSFKFRTSVATIGIRGTDYTVRYCEGEACGALFGASVAVVDGGVSLSNAGGEAQLNKGEFARAESADSAPYNAPMPEGFLDLSLDVSKVKVVEATWWESLLKTARTWFHSEE